MIDDVVPIGLALAAAVLFGTSSVIARRGLRRLDAHLGAIITIGTALALYTLSAPLWMRAEHWSGPGVWVFALCGLIHPLMSMYLTYEASARVGATIASTFASIAPLFAALTAVAFLGEHVGTLVALGTGATIVGVMTISWGPQGVPRVLRVALLLAVGVAVIRGLNHTIGKWGLELLPNVFMASFVSFAVSFAGALAAYRVHRGKLPRAVPAAELAPFVMTGGFICVAIVCMYAALQLGRVVVVSPVVNTYPIFALVTAWLLRDEPVTARLVAGVGIVVAGVALISVGNAR